MTVADLLPGDPWCVRTDRGATGSLSVDTVDLAGTPPEITISAFVR